MRLLPALCTAIQESTGGRGAMHVLCHTYSFTNGERGVLRESVWCRGSIEWSVLDECAVGCCEVWVCFVTYLCTGRKALVLLGDFNMAPDKEGWCTL